MIARADRRKDRPQTHPILTTRASVTKSRKCTERANCLEHGWHSWALSACQKCWSALCACGHCERFIAHDKQAARLSLTCFGHQVEKSCHDSGEQGPQRLEHALHAVVSPRALRVLFVLVEWRPEDINCEHGCRERERQRGQDRMILRVMLAFLLLARITSTTNGAKNKKCLACFLLSRKAHAMFSGKLWNVLQTQTGYLQTRRTALPGLSTMICLRPVITRRKSKEWALCEQSMQHCVSFTTVLETCNRPRRKLQVRPQQDGTSSSMCVAVDMPHFFAITCRIESVTHTNGK